MDLRKLVTVVDTVHSEAGLVLDVPQTKVAVAAVIANPYAGRYEPDLSALASAAIELSQLMTRRILEILPGRPESYGKAAIVGTSGELEHAAAVLHPTFGGPVRELLGGGAAILPSAKKRAGPGAAIDVPLHAIKAAYVRSHFDAIEVRVPDAPLPDELMVVLAMADSGRPLARVGGLALADAVGSDGLR